MEPMIKGYGKAVFAVFVLLSLVAILAVILL